MKMLMHLGHTPDEIASSLKCLGVKGVKHTAHFLNPIVRYVLSKVGGTSDINVVTGKTLRIKYTDRTQVESPLPAAVVDFLVAFNGGIYPDLECRP